MGVQFSPLKSEMAVRTLFQQSVAERSGAVWLLRPGEKRPSVSHLFYWNVSATQACSLSEISHHAVRGPSMWRGTYVLQSPAEPSFLVIPSFMSDVWVKKAPDDASPQPAESPPAIWIFPAEGTRRCGAETSRHFCALSKFLTRGVTWRSSGCFMLPSLGWSYAVIDNCYFQQNHQLLLAPPPPKTFVFHIHFHSWDRASFQ